MFLVKPIRGYPGSAYFPMRLDMGEDTGLMSLMPGHDQALSPQ